MATLRDIKARITGVKNTQQITKAMKMVAAARLRRAQENIMNARPYSRKIAEVFSNLLSAEKSTANPFFTERPSQKVALIILTSDRGLCGAFNMNVIRRAENLVEDDYKDINEAGNLSLYCIGKKCVDYFSKREYNLTGSYTGIFSKLEFDFASKLVNEISEKFLKNEYDKVEIIYNQFKSVMQQNLVVEQFLPVVALESENSDRKNVSEYIYEPDKISIIDSIIPRHLKAQVWKALLESYASELGARMTAMDMATENAAELIKSLNITYNKERQASITKEILEIVSGANVLKGN